ncbi:MAG: cohesin domain-containing protein [Chloroflexota bacterium]
MKPILSVVLAVLIAVILVPAVAAQSAETVWLSASATSYKTNETVIVTVNALSGTQIQGFTFQIRYDPACLQPVGATSPIPGMNGLALPQTPGLVDATFASTAPQAAGGVIAEVRFLSLGGCQTDLTLESAALAVRNADGFAAPLPNVTVGEKTVALAIDKEVGNPEAAPAVSGGTPLPLAPEPGPASPATVGIPFWLVILLVIGASVAGVIVAVIFLRKPSSSSW